MFPSRRGGAPLEDRAPSAMKEVGAATTRSSPRLSRMASGSRNASAPRPMVLAWMGGDGTRRPRLRPGGKRWHSSRASSSRNVSVPVGGAGEARRRWALAVLPDAARGTELDGGSARPGAGVRVAPRGGGGSRLAPRQARAVPRAGGWCLLGFGGQRREGKPPRGRTPTRVRTATRGRTSTTRRSLRGRGSASPSVERSPSSRRAG